MQSERIVERGPTDISLAPHYSWQTVGTEVFGSSLYQGDIGIGIMLVNTSPAPLFGQCAPLNYSLWVQLPT